MLRLCLFDLDQTLFDTEDMKCLRQMGVGRRDAAYVQEVRDAFRGRNRFLIDDSWVWAISCTANIGVFTRAPRSYAETILEDAQLNWDVIIAYEDVQNAKPHREGIYKAMRACGLDVERDLAKVWLIGDSDIDVRAAYHAGCHAALFRGGWPHQYEKTHWRSLELLPDAILENRTELEEFFHNPAQRLPDLECLLTDRAQAPSHPRFDKVNKFFPNERSPHAIYAAGRSFANYQTLDARRRWHNLSRSIQEHKESNIFPDEWVLTVKRFIESHYKFLAPSPFPNELVITVVPPRPGRKPRLNHFLSQLKAHYGENPHVQRMSLVFEPDILAYREGVRSQSREHLTPDERFENVRDHLFVANPGSANRRRFLVIDDVSTTGATLLYAKRYLEQAGASRVDCFTLAMNISNPVRNL